MFLMKLLFLKSKDGLRQLEINNPSRTHTLGEDEAIAVFNGEKKDRF